MNRIFLSVSIRDDKTAAQKARVDVLNILEKIGYQKVFFPRFNSLGTIIRFWKALSASVKKGGHIVVEYPCWSRKRLYLVRFFCMLKGVRFYAVIHDIAALRLGESAAKDMTTLKLFDGLISHNFSMSAWLRKMGYTKEIINLDLFDYCLDPGHALYHAGQLSSPLNVMYAGNLAYEKVSYIYDSRLKDFHNFRLSLYGQNIEMERLNGLATMYKGVFSPDQPAFDERFHFGLIWEGTSLDTCEGILGDYIRYNNPHKFSLYISLGLPVIVWKEAAIAGLVTKYNIGFLVDRIEDIEAQAAGITETQYQEYVRNIRSLAQEVRRGSFLQAAVAKLEKA